MTSQAKNTIWRWNMSAMLVAALLTQTSISGAKASTPSPHIFQVFPTMQLANKSQIIPESYDKSVFPPSSDGSPMQCFLRFALENILDIDEAKGAVWTTNTVDGSQSQPANYTNVIKHRFLRYQIYLAVFWPDSRLGDPDLFANVSTIWLPPELQEKLWLPDIMIYNLEAMSAVSVLRKLGKLLLFKNGYVMLSMYARTTVTCEMDFSSYPFDTQECYVEFGSYNYDDGGMVWGWTPASQNIYSNDQLARNNFFVSIERSGPLTRCFDANNCYSTVMVTVRLQRRTTFFLWHTFLPCVLLVATSWLSMFLPPEIIPGRMVLCITSLLALLTMFTSSLTGLEVSYIRASDIWYVGCLVFDFLIILEYVVLIFVQRTSRQRSEDELTWVRPSRVHPSQSKVSKTVTSRTWMRCFRAVATWLEDPDHMDRVSRWLLVVLFVGFNLGYWAWFLWF